MMYRRPCCPDRPHRPSQAHRALILALMTCAACGEDPRGTDAPPSTGADATPPTDAGPATTPDVSTADAREGGSGGGEDASAAIDATVPPDSVAAGLAALGAAPCVDNPEFLCARLDVPVNHDRPADGTLSLAVAVRPASGAASSGLLVNVSGGPGYGGLAEMDDWAWLDPRIRDTFDMVFFDLRGVDGSGGFECPEAAAAWYGRGLRATTADARAELAQRAARFAEDCPAEIGQPVARLAFHDTTQAAHDVEHLRRALGGGLVTLAGVSYGTQLSQTYATLYPAHVRAVILDGPIDLTRRGIEYATSLGAAVHDVLDRTLAACDAEPDCAADFAPDTAASTWQALADRLEAAPVELDFPLASGAWRTRTFDRVELDHLATVAVYEETQRSLFLRALAATRRGALVPLRRLADAYGGVDEETEAADHSGFSDAIYYTVTCNDYGRVAGGPGAFLEACAAVVAAAPGSANEACFGDLPCATWPGAESEAPRPDVFAPAGIPVLVIHSDADVATPVSQGEAVVAALRAAGSKVRAISVRGGHHVMWGSDDCVDAATHVFLFAPDVPRADTNCDVDLLGFTLPLSPESAEGYAEPTVFAGSLVDELYALPWFPWGSAWGCDAGGTGEVDDTGVVSLTACSFVAGLVVDGGGFYDWETETLDLTVEVSGAQQGELAISEDGEGGLVVSGRWNGAVLEE